MRRKEKEIIDKKEIEEILQKSMVCRLAMVDKDKPYMVPMSFGYKDDNLYIHSAGRGRKIDLIQKNPNVCFEVDEVIKFNKAQLACDWGLDFKSVIGAGKAQILEDSKEKIKGLDIIMSQYSGRTFEYSDEMLAKTMVIKVAVDWMTGKKS